MAEFVQRENRYNNGLADIVQSFAIGCVIADNAAKDAYVERQIKLMNQEKPNVDFVAKTTLIGIEQPLETKVSVPKIVLAPSDSFIIERANLTLDMTVSAHAEDNLSVKSDTEVEGSAKVGLGLFSASMRVKASVSVASDKKRSSDYTSTTHADLTMCQGPAPEGLMKIIDSLNATTVRALELNSVLIDAQATAAAGEVEEKAGEPVQE